MTVYRSGSDPPPASSRWRRVAEAWFPLTFIVLFAWLDWLMHRSAVFILVVGGAAVAGILYRKEIAARLRLKQTLDRLHPVARALVASSPAVLYFVVRGAGAGASRLVVLAAVVATVVCAARYGRLLDAKLRGFYVMRDRMLGHRARLALVVVVPVVLGFAVVHGSITELPALFGLPTRTPQLAVGLGHTVRMLVATVLAAASAFLLVREVRR